MVVYANLVRGVSTLPDSVFDPHSMEGGRMGVRVSNLLGGRLDGLLDEVNQVGGA